MIKLKKVKIDPNRMVNNLTQMSSHPNLLSRTQVLERLGGRSTSWLYQEMAEGRFPRPIRLGLSAVAWVEQEISDYIARHIADSRVTLYAKPRKRQGKKASCISERPN